MRTFVYAEGVSIGTNRDELRSEDDAYPTQRAVHDLFGMKVRQALADLADLFTACQRRPTDQDHETHPTTEPARSTAKPAAIFQPGDEAPHVAVILPREHHAHATFKRSDVDAEER